MKDFFLNRFKEPTSWIAIFMVAGSFGIELTEVQQNAITFLAIVMFGAPETSIKTYMKEKNLEKKRIDPK